jgi:SAM-dependent methyltransferase
VSPSEHLKELERIRSVYGRRDATDYGARYTHFDAGNLFTIQDRERLMTGVLGGAGYFPLKGRSILEVGCGGGCWLRQFIHWGADPEQVCGVELDAGRADEARRSCPSGVRILNADAAHTPLPDASFDLVFQSTVFSSILNDGVRRALAAEMLRLVKPGGLVLWYDFRFDNPRNENVRGVTRSEVRGLFPEAEIRFYTVTLAPFLARAVAPVSWLACHLLNAVPLLRTHILAAIRRA